MISDIVAFLLSDTAAWSWTQCVGLFVAAMLALEFISFGTRHMNFPDKICQAPHCLLCSANLYVVC